jgi:hypothetical protein
MLIPILDMLKIALAAGVGGAMGLMPSAHQESVMYQASDTQFHHNSGGHLTEARDATPEVIARDMIMKVCAQHAFHLYNIGFSNMHFFYPNPGKYFISL